MNHKEKTRGEQVSAPLVIFCSNCRAIVGDSYSWLGADSELRSFSLYDKSKEVIVNEELETSKQGIDIGSTFTTMNCSSCEAYLGKVYKTTPRSLDHIRDMYTFSIDKVSLYQLGPSEHSSDFFALKNEQMMDLPALSKLQDNMRKAQSLICYLNERIIKLEQTIENQDKKREEIKKDSDLEAFHDDKTSAAVNLKENKEEGITMEDDSSIEEEEIIADKRSTVKKREIGDRKEQGFESSKKHKIDNKSVEKTRASMKEAARRKIVKSFKLRR